jgi:hypothetical protein
MTVEEIAMRHWVRALGTALSLSVLVACGGPTNGNPPGGPGSGGNGASGGSSGAGGMPFDASRKLMSLTPAEAIQVCGQMTSYEVQNISKLGLCRSSGITTAILAATIDSTSTDADLVTACNVAVDQCIGYPTDPNVSCPLGDPSTCSPTPTVNDLMKCVMDDVDAVNAALLSLPACPSITRAWLNANGTNAGKVTTPASCTALAAECPGFVASM